MRAHSKLSSFMLVTLIALGTAVAGLGSMQAQAQEVVQEPLFLANRIKPNFIMAVDDSGSMDFETLIQGNDGSAWWNYTRRSFFGLNENDLVVNGSERPNFNKNGVSNDATWKKYSYLFPAGTGVDGKSLVDSTNDHFAIPPTPDYAWSRSSDYNTAYFNPLVNYTPWKRYDGSTFPNIVSTDAPADPQRGTRRFDLTNNFTYTGANAEFMFGRYMVIPTGAYYRVGTCSNGGVSPSSTSDPLQSGALTGFRLATADRTVGGSESRSRCSVAMAYFPATFYVRNEGGRPAAIAATIGYDPSKIDYTAMSPGDASGVGKVQMARFEIKASNFTSGYSAAIQNFANWFSYYRKRHLAARAGLTQAFDGFSFINAGYFTINDRVNVTMRDMSGATGRQNIYAQILALDGSGGTPNKDATDYMGTQFRRTGTGAPITLSCQRNFGLLFTDGFSDPTASSSYGNVDGTMSVPFRDSTGNTLADIATKHYNDNLRPDMEAGKVPVPNQCSGSAPSPKLDCRRDPHMNFYGITLGSRGLIYDPDALPAQDPFTTAVTWPGPYPARSPSAVDDIWHATINTRGRFLNARTPKEISDAIRSVLIAVEDASVPAGRDATSGARVTADTFYIIPSFSTKKNGTDWTGSMVAYRIETDGTLGGLLWSTGSTDDGDAGDKLPAAASRNLLMATTAGTSTTRVVSAVNPANLGGTTAQQFAKIGLTATELTLYPGLTPTQAVNYLRGDQSLEQTYNSSGVLVSGTLRARGSRFGDIINSTPVIFTGKENYGYSALPGTAGTSYNAFLQGRMNMRPMVYVGANDGYLHGIDGDNGIESFGFLPNGVLGNMGQLISPTYQHRYYVDGQIVVSDAQIGGAWGTMLVGSAGAGAKSIFGINVTAPRSVTASKIMWEVTGSNNADVGHMLGRPLLLPVRGAAGPQWVVITGNGYNSTYAKPALLVLDATTGAVLATLRPNVGTSTTANGLGNLVAVADSDGYVSKIYGGDLDGNVWKFNLLGSNPVAWNVAFNNMPFFRARDGAGNAQPITGGFDVAKGPNNGIYLYFGTGRYFAAGDNNVDSNTQVQSLYAVLDAGAANTNSATSGTVVGGRANLSQRTLTSQVAGTTATRAISTGEVNFLTQSGWYLDLRVTGLPIKGEKFIGYPRVEGGQIFFATFEPIGDACTPGGLNWLYGLDAITGNAALSNIRIPGQDTDGDGQDDLLCASGCGAVAAGTGAPSPESVVLGLGPVCPPGSAGCPVPVTCEAEPSNPACVPEDDLFNQDSYQGCVKIISVGGKQVVQPRPCGRQAWRQVR